MGYLKIQDEDLRHDPLRSLFTSLLTRYELVLFFNWDTIEKLTAFVKLPARATK